MNVHANRFPLVDSVRALAALWIMTFHAAYISGFLGVDTPLRPFLSQAGTGAMVFFVVSGFVLYRPFALAHLRGRRRPDPRAFAWGRVLRIIPPYWLALTLVALWLGLDEVFTGSGIPTYYGFAQIYRPSMALGGISQAWTLCVEVTFYAFLPIWALAMRAVGRSLSAPARLRAELAALAALFAASLAFKVWLLTRFDPASLHGGPRFIPLPNYLDAFAVGMALAVLTAWWDGRDELPRAFALIGRRPWLPWLAALVVIWIAGAAIGFTGAAGQHFSRRMFLSRWELQLLAGSLILLPAVFGGPARSAVRGILANRLLLWVGLVSYGFYLYHYAIIDKLDRGLGGTLHTNGGRFAVYVALTVPATMVIAAASYYGLERPVLKLKRLVRPRRAPEPGEALAEPAPVTPVAAPRASR